MGMDHRAERQRNSPETKETPPNTDVISQLYNESFGLCWGSTQGWKNESAEKNSTEYGEGAWVVNPDDMCKPAVTEKNKPA